MDKMSLRFIGSRAALPGLLACWVVAVAACNETPSPIGASDQGVVETPCENAADCSGAVLPAERDDDSDGFNECPGFFYDCDDADLRAHPGQQAYFSRSDGPRAGVGGWDFDCSGSETRLYTSAGSCALLSTCSLSDGWVNGTPACGATGSWLGNCTSLAGLCVASTPVSREQPCH